jgi:hypothetical protein
MARIGPALVADDDVGVFGQDIDDLALAFIAPLDADYDEITHCQTVPHRADTKKWL